MSSDHLGNRLACPNCLSPDHLGENAVGWRNVRSARMVAGRVVVDLKERTTHDAERVSFFCTNKGCDENEEISDRRLVQIDFEGNVVPRSSTEQLTL